jgi:alpha-tubulin suppressor-like RCC1 family protein
VSSHRALDGTAKRATAIALTVVAAVTAACGRIAEDDVATSLDATSSDDAARDVLDGSSLDAGRKEAGAIRFGRRTLALGDEHTCMRVADGTVLCWGDDSEGELATDTTDRRSPLPTPVLTSPGGVALADVVDIAAASRHTCARKADLTVVCWGRLEGAFPTLVTVGPDGAPLQDVAQIALGTAHACALQTDGTLLCWGHNTFGQLGDGTTTPHPLPTPVLVAPGGPPLTDVADVAAGAAHTCARMTDGTVMCWGSADHGEIGDGTRAPAVGTDRPSRPSPTRVLVALGGPPLMNVGSIFAGETQSCARKIDGTVACWGGIPSSTSGFELSATVILATPDGPPLANVADMALGQGWPFTCLRGDAGNVLCWGSNGQGELGDGTRVNRRSPLPVAVTTDGSPFGDVVEIAAGGAHACALTSKGKTFCWGRNREGQVGDGSTTESRLLPTPVTLP